MILRLGSGQATRRSCGPKAALLDRAARAGLPVPPGVIVTDEAWRSALARGLVRLGGSGSRRPVFVPDPSLLVHLIGLPSFAGPLAVRAAFSSEEGGGETVSGDLVPGLFVEGRRPAALAAGLAGVWAAAYRRPRGFRRDVIAHEMVRARAEGRVFLQSGYEDDLVEAASRVARGLAARPVSRPARPLPRIRRTERPTEPDPVSARLQVLVREVRRAFGDGDWIVEWADDGNRVWVVQIGALTEVPRRNEAFTTASHRDLLPDLPSTLMTSLIGSCATGLFGSYRRFDPGLPTARPLLEIVHGRPMLNLTLLTDMVRRWGLPTRLVTGSIGGAADRDFGLQPGRMLCHAPVLMRFLSAQLRSVRSARQTGETILERTEPPPSGVGEILDELCRIYGVLVREMLPLTGALSVPLALLRGAGTLPELARRWRFTATEMREGLDELRSLASTRPAVADELGRGELPADPAVQQGVEDWLSRFGHRGVYESDIARPRYREDPGLILRSLASPGVALPPTPPRSLASRLLWPVAWHAERTLRAREGLRSAAMVGFERLRRALLEHARELVDDGVLPKADALFDLTVDEVHRLGDGFRPDDAFWSARREEIEAQQARDVPDVLHRDQGAGPRPTGEAAGRRFEGRGLTSGEVEGVAWVIDEPGEEPPADLSPEKTILVARAVDLGWLAPFTRVAAVAVETGGDLSYGSIALREMGVPAVTNARGLTHALRTGDRLVLRAAEGTVEWLA